MREGERESFKIGNCSKRNDDDDDGDGDEEGLYEHLAWKYVNVHSYKMALINSETHQSKA